MHADVSSIHADEKHSMHDNVTDARPTAQRLFAKHGVCDRESPLSPPIFQPDPAPRGSHGSLGLRSQTTTPQDQQPSKAQPSKARGQTVDPFGFQCSKFPKPDSGKSSIKTKSMRTALGLSSPSPSRQKQGSLKAMGFVSKKPSTLRQPVLQSPDRCKRTPPVKRRSEGGFIKKTGASVKRHRRSSRRPVDPSMEQDEDEGCDPASEGCTKVFLSRGAGRDAAGSQDAASALLGSFYGPAPGGI